jgi:hypothetical protein
MKTQLLVVGLIAAAAAAPSLAQNVSSPGYFMQWEGTLVPCDMNPIVGWPLPNETPFDSDAQYDWLILETMVSDPIHGGPFYLWPDRSCLDGGNIDATREFGFSMGVLVIWSDVDGSETGRWSQGELLLMSMLGMNHQENDGHSALSMWVDFNGKTPYSIEFVGSTTESWAGRWFNEYGPGYLIRGYGTAVWYEQDPAYHQYGMLDNFEVEPLIWHLGDVNLDCARNYDDVPAFMAQLFGHDHDMTRHVLADMDEDGTVTMQDAMIFLDTLFGSLQ